MNRTTPRLFAVVVTYRREALLARSLDALFKQRVSPHLTVVVDNAPSASSRRVVGETSEGRNVEYVPMAENTGPAGGRAVGLERVVDRAADHDWVVLLDDDDPLPHEETLLRLYEFGVATQASDPATGGVGLRGGRFDLAKARTMPVDQTAPRPQVDHLHGGFFPMYRVGAVRTVGGFDPKYFFGFEELDYGLRMTDRGYTLYVDNDHFRGVEQVMGHPPPRRLPRWHLEEASWRRYYSLRNLSYILLQRSGRYPAVRVALVRGLLKPLVNLPLQPRLALAHLRMNARAVRDAWTGKMYVTEPPADPAARSPEPFGR